MANTEGLKTLGDYRKVAKGSLYSLADYVEKESKDNSAYDATKVALTHIINLIRFSRSETAIKCSWNAFYLPETKYAFRNLQLFECIKLMEFAIAYKNIQYIDELFPNWPKRPDVNARVFTAAGISFLEAAFNFVHELGRDMILILQNAYKKYRKEVNIGYRDPFKFLNKTPTVNDLEINPEPDIIIKTWFDDVINVIQREFSEQEYSDHKLTAEYNSTHKQLEYEWNIAQETEPQEKDGQSKKQPKKITKLTDFILNKCEDTTSISSKANRIHEFVKNRKIKFMPEPVNKPKDNQTKLYDEEELWKIWPKLKEKIVSLPNLKD